MNKHKKTVNRVALLGLFSAVAIIFGYVETLLPVFVGVPGIKLGLANLAVLFLLDRNSLPKAADYSSLANAAIVSVIRILVIGFLFGNMFSILYSLAGASLSLGCMYIARRHTTFNLIGISVIGGVMHNVGQFLVALYLVKNTAIIYYAPALLVSGVLTGVLIGILTMEVKKRLKFLA